MVRHKLLLILVILLVVASHPLSASDSIGQVSRLQGQAEAILDGESLTLTLGTPVLHAHTLVTKQDGRLEVKLLDGTTLILGSNAKLRIDAMVFDQSDQANQLSVLVRGAFRLITGKINKTVGATVNVRTPAAVLSVRGTDVWGGPIDGNYGVFLIEGEVVVRTAGGEVTMTRSGSGTNIVGTASAPAPATIWSQEKIERALATVSFR